VDSQFEGEEGDGHDLRPISLDFKDLLLFAVEGVWEGTYFLLWGFVSLPSLRILSLLISIGSLCFLGRFLLGDPLMNDLDCEVRVLSKWIVDI
jgi:hypothetical protein